MKTLIGASQAATFLLAFAFGIPAETGRELYRFNGLDA